MNKQIFGYTLAEVLITLGIIGVVAAITIPSLITKINNRGYVEKLLKAYSTLQTATNSIVQEEGLPSTWRWTNRIIDTSNAANERILELYKNKLKVVYSCAQSWRETKCMVDVEDVKALNKQAADIYGYATVYGDYQAILADNTLIGFRFTVNTWAVFWGEPSKLGFAIDINGKKKPNIVGRDIFFFYLEDATGKVIPVISENIDDPFLKSFANTCEINKTGQSCAYRVITEGKMNY